MKDVRTLAILATLTTVAAQAKRGLPRFFGTDVQVPANACSRPVELGRLVSI